MNTHTRNRNRSPLAPTGQRPNAGGRPTCGASEVTLLVLGFAFLLAVAGVILFVFLEFDTNPAAGNAPIGPDIENTEHAHTGPSTGPLGPDGTRVVLGPDGQPLDGLRSGASVEVGADLAYRSAPKLFDGTGRITGVVEAPSNGVFPDTWRLVIEPSLYVQGREHAATRQEFEFEGAQRTFELDDLPLGAYRLFAAGKGVDCPAHEILLFRVAGQSATKMHKHILMRFHAVRGATGSVQDADGNAVGDLPVFLVPAASGDGASGDGPESDPEPVSASDVLSTTTNAAGEWNLPKIQAGTYRVLLGFLQRPLIKPPALIVHPAGSGNPPTRHAAQVPVTGTLHLRVMDAMGRGLPGARVRGIGPSPVDVEVDSVGVATARFLLPGAYRLNADYAALELSGEGRFEVKAQSEPQVADLFCRP